MLPGDCLSGTDWQKLSSVSFKPGYIEELCNAFSDFTNGKKLAHYNKIFNLIHSYKTASKGKPSLSFSPK